MSDDIDDYRTAILSRTKPVSRIKWFYKGNPGNIYWNDFNKQETRS